MSDRHVRKMLRRTASGEPFEVAPAIATLRKLARLAFIAQQFGYEYADIRQGGGPQGNGFVMLLVPDPRPQARARAARNRAQYPDASDGGALPPLVPEEVELLKARITFDITTRYTDRQRIVLTGVGAVPLAVPIGFQLGTGATAVVLAGAVWAALMALLPVGFAVNRRYRAKYAALLQAAGFTPVTDGRGRLRYLPPGGRLPGHGNPFAVGT
ncbi:hypothetical protein H0H10_23475 [Streptomyces sp. TRM S81-3]|uniref:Integral membrane protein n=1 Tax=Streptomyces griseicoloratus TaxID=2752516 RepID=A0A926QTI1_9ACTN|nr:hypothetical protein [Streptomyces griseicoloratus]MBD0422077.1 hypothetical protein [Streptomyces griseicoloratus]